MRFARLFGAALLLTPLALAPVTRADDLRAALAHYRAVPLAEGPTRVTLLGGGRGDLVMKGYRENFNTHSWHEVTFYVHRPDATRALRWEVVPLVAGGRVESTFRTVNGATCVLRDLRLLAPRAGGKASAALLVAERSLGDSFEDSLAVTFALYRLETTDRTEPGVPGIAFVRGDTLVTRARYCDVERALAKELGL